MGPSGSGKTTLLDVLAGRAAVRGRGGAVVPASRRGAVVASAQAEPYPPPTQAGERAGDMAYGGRAASPSFLRRFTGAGGKLDL